MEQELSQDIKQLKLAYLVQDYFHTTSAEVTSSSRVQRIADTRNAIVLLSFALDFPIESTAQVIGRSVRKTQMIISHCRKLYKSDILLHNIINTLYEDAIQRGLSGDYPTAPQHYCNYIHQPLPIDKTKGASETSQEADCPHQKVSLGFHFSQEEERRIAYAITSAQKFMQSYGKGNRVSSIDYSHYAQSHIPTLSTLPPYTTERKKIKWDKTRCNELLKLRATMSIRQLAKHFDSSPSAISRQLHILKTQSL